jgi:MFS family permease
LARSEARHDPYAAFRHKAFTRYLIGSLLLSVGTAGQGLAVRWEVYQRTGEELSVGWAALAQALPMLLFTLPAGVLADRIDRRIIMVIGLIGATMTSVGLGLVSMAQGPVWAIYGLLFLDASFLRAAWPARIALMPMLVPRQDFESATKWRTSGFQVSGLIGPVIAGFIMVWSIPATYFLAAVSSALFIGLLVSLDVDTRPPPGAAGRGLSGAIADLAEGLRFVWRNKLLLGAISLDLFAVLLGGAVYLLPIFATDIFAVGEAGLGLMQAAPAAGALLTALVLAYLPPMRHAGRTMFFAVAGFGVATIVFGLTDSFAIALAMLFLTGVTDNVSVVVRHTLVQMATPEAMRGRVSSVNAVFIGSSNELGGFESGVVAQAFGARISVVSGGVGTLLVVGLWSWMFPGLRKLRGLADPHEETDKAKA